MRTLLLLTVAVLIASQAWAGTATTIIQWSPEPNSATYNVERKINAGAWVAVGTVTAPATQFQDQNIPVNPGDTISHQVQGMNADGVAGPWSAACSHTVTSIPGQVTITECTTTVQMP